MTASPGVPAELRARFIAWGQQHLFKYIDDSDFRKQFGISDHDIAEFVSQLQSVDFPRLQALLAEAKSDSSANHFSPPDSREILALSDLTPEVIAKWRDVGYAAIRRGEVAVCVLAGGQGTRMGVAPDESKAMYCLGGKLLSGKKFVFELFIERLKKLVDLAIGHNKERGPASIPLLIMTSPINNEKVGNFLRAHDFFAYEDMHLFQQGTLPAMSLDGKHLLLETHSKLALSPDGNGGVYHSLLASGKLAELKTRNVKYLHVVSVDNASCLPADPVFIGACIDAQCEIGNKVVWKSDWREKVGVIAKKNGKTSVVEYSDLFNPELGIDNPLIRATTEGGKLLFGAGNICNHFYTIEGLDRILPKVTSHYHLALKKVACVDLSTDQIVAKPASNTGIKLESFIFDAFELANSSLVFEAEREAEFSPMKNATGDDSPDSAVRQMFATWRKWLISAGARFDSSGTPLLVEIAPEVSYAGEGLELLDGHVFTKNTLVNSEWLKAHNLLR